MGKAEFEKWLANEAFVEEGEKDRGSIFTDIAKVRVELAFEGWANNLKQYFPYKPDDPESRKDARRQCVSYIDSGPKGEYDQYPSDGILVTVYGDNIPTNPNGSLGFDPQSFAKKWDNDSRLTEEERSKINGSMPYNLMLEGLKINSDAFNTEKWCKVSQEIDVWQKYKGKTNKKGNPLRIHVVQKVYSSEAEAKADALTIKASKPQDNVNESGLSPTALENFKTLEQFQAMSAEIHKHIANATKGVGVLNNEIEALSLVKAKRYVGEQLGFEVSDLELIKVETPI